VPLLTVAKIQSLKPRATVYRVTDNGGLSIEVRPTGSKLWRYRYRYFNRANMIGLGAFPAISLADARQARDAARALLRSGRDPSAERQAEHMRRKLATTNSFEAVARDWLEVKRHEWTSGQFEKELARLENHAFPWIGKHPIAEVGVIEIRPLLTRLVKGGHIEQAHRLRHELSRVFRFAVALMAATHDPAAALRETLPARPKQNYAAITDPAQAGELLRAIDGFGGTFPTACALKLSPMWFVRPGEIRAAEWQEFDLDAAEWVIPASRRKLKRSQKESARTLPHVVPLSTQAIRILRELHPLTGHGRFLFPGARDSRRPMSENTVNAALRRLGFDRDTMTGHGFRHMASTMLNELGFNGDVIERQLSHKEPGVRGVYNKAEHMPERRKMMQAWADHLDALRAAGDKVVSIGRKRA